MGFRGVAYVASSELQSRLARHGANRNFHRELNRVVDQPVFHFNHLSDRHRETNAFGQARGEQFIGQYAEMLRIILEFDDVIMPVRGAHEMGLGATAPAANMLNGLDRHAEILCEKELYGICGIRS
jgi:hypothetical protein